MSDITYRWIVYVQHNISGHIPSPAFAESIDRAKEILTDEGGEPGTSAFLYPYTDEDADLANEFQGIGNPFDYPSRVFEIGPRGGIRSVIV